MMCPGSPRAQPQAQANDAKTSVSAEDCEIKVHDAASPVAAASADGGSPSAAVGTPSPTSASGQVAEEASEGQPTGDDEDGEDEDCAEEAFLNLKVDAKAAKQCRVKGCGQVMVDPRHVLCQQHKDGDPIHYGTSMYAFCRRGSHFAPWNLFQAPECDDGRKTTRSWGLEEVMHQRLRRCCRPCLDKRRIHRLKSMGKKVVPFQRQASAMPYTEGAKAEVAKLAPLTRTGGPKPPKRSMTVMEELERKRLRTEAANGDSEHDSADDPEWPSIRRNPPRSARWRNSVMAQPMSTAVATVVKSELQPQTPTQPHWQPAAAVSDAQTAEPSSILPSHYAYLPSSGDAATPLQDQPADSWTAGVPFMLWPTAENIEFFLSL